MKIGLKIALAAMLLSVSNAQFKEDCKDAKNNDMSSDSQCQPAKPHCCHLQNTVTSQEIKMCMSRQQINDEKIVGEIKDDETDTNNVWKYTCPTMISTCDSLNDCKKSGQNEDGFCCSTSIKFPAKHNDTIKTCIPKYKEIPAGTTPNDSPMGDFDKLVEYRKDDGNTASTSAGELTYTYSCPSMLADCEVFKKDGGKFVLDDNDQKIFEDDYACGKTSLADKTHCCSLQSTEPNMPGSFKMCMKHDKGISPFGQYEHVDQTDANKKIKLKYICPSLVANCSDTDTCDAKSGAPHCCNLEAQKPGIKGSNKMCMASPGNITGKFDFVDFKVKEATEKIEFSYKCPATVLQNCTGVSTDTTEDECDYKQPYCCRLKNTDYKWKEGAGTSDIHMCMNTPRQKGKKMKDKWEDPTKTAVFDYDCPETTFDAAASSYDDFFDYAIDFKLGNNKKLKKAGLKYDQCKTNSDCPETIKDSRSCCVESVMSLGDWDMEGNLVNMTNSTVYRCMKEQIPDSQIFTEIDDYYVDMKCTEPLAASRFSLLASLGSLAIAIATYIF